MSFEDLKTNIRHFLRLHFSDFPKANVYIACSAGVDSMVLASLMADICESEGFLKPHLLHVNYFLRQEDSILDEQLVLQFATKHQMKCLVKRVPESEAQKMREQPANLQSWARDLRYQWFGKQVESESGDLIALAHHGDDLAENAIMRLARGSALDIGGMRDWSWPFWRPFLQVKKSDLYDFAARKNVPYREDLTNASLKYTRNVVRHRVMQELNTLYPGASQRVASWASDLQDLSDFFQDQFTEIFQAERLDAASLIGKPTGVCLLIIAGFLRQKTQPYLVLHRRQLVRIHQRLVGNQNRELWSEDLPEKWRVCIKAASLIVMEKKARFAARALQHRAAILNQKDMSFLEEGAILRSKDSSRE